MAYNLKNPEIVDGTESTWLKGKPVAFTVENPDFEKSPFTGMSRQHWLDAARFLTEGIFQHVDSIDDPIVMPQAKRDQLSPAR